MYTVLMVIFVLNAVALIAFVLLQQGKGADAGAAFGSGASASVFGARGSASFLSRTTAVLATIFFVLAMVLAWMSQQPVESSSIAERAPLTQPETPAETDEKKEPEPTDGGGQL